MTDSNATPTRLKIEGYSDYRLIGDSVFCLSKEKEVNVGYKKRNNEPYLRLIDDLGNRKQLTPKKIRCLAGLKLALPDDAKELRGSDGKYFIDKSGNVYSFAIKNPEGVKLTPLVLRKKYPEVKVKYLGKRGMMAVHRLMADTFLIEGYAAKGLVCMHKDNNKHNYCLENLSIGTHEQNIRDARRDGLYPSFYFDKDSPLQPKAYRDSLKRPDML